ncbi:MAG TPA: replication-associated recombination protein A [Bacteroidota bacterium]|nr:replication-associated recombination protein A [Bacteroidota bacterium]
MELFENTKVQPKVNANAPLAERVRPRTIDELVGQEHLLGADKPLRVMIESDELRSIILWGPPGTGKTTLARVIANHTKAEFFSLNAVSSGVKEVREVIAKAEKLQKQAHRRTVLFIDEIHRFNKAQQDALLHSVEDGIIVLIGATTENPSFEVISPLLSRARVYVLEPLGKKEMEKILELALGRDKVVSKEKVQIEDREFLYLLSGGDARMMLNGLESAFFFTKPDPHGVRSISKSALEEAFQRKFTVYDKKGEQHYDTISAFIKSLRGCDPDGAVYWMARMLDGGEDPKFIARRMIVLASEDIGNADPMASVVATNCFAAVDVVGMPEARIILSQAATYLASAPKSNASYVAISEALQDVHEQPNLGVPLHLRNAPTKLMKDLGYGEEYRYGHSFDGNFVEQEYLPDNLKDKLYYRPSENGAERQIKERLAGWWKKKRGQH